MDFEFEKGFQIELFGAAVEQLREMLDAPETVKQNKKIYRFAVYRNFSLSYYMFFAWFMATVDISEDESFMMEDDDGIFSYAFRKGIFKEADRKVIETAEEIFEAVHLYTDSTNLSDDEIMRWMPKICTFFERYLMEQIAGAHVDQVKEIHA